MIRIEYIQVPQKYLDFIDYFKKKIKKWVKKGSMGNASTKVILNDDCKLLFRYLIQADNLKKVLLLSADEIPQLINYIEKKFPSLKDCRLKKADADRRLFDCLSKAFDALGFCDTKFPDFELSCSLGIKACPYCNAEDIVIQDLQKEGVYIRNSELDHFYPRELYPYLSISLYNLVPSGSICNGGNCKHNKDTYQIQLVNPFSLPDSDGIVFELNIIDKGILSYRTFEQACRIKTIVMRPAMSVNKQMFLIESRYEKEILHARTIWCSFKECASVGYQNMIDTKAKLLNTTLTFDEWFELETQVNPNDYNGKKLSKLTMDIWRQLDSMKP